MPRVHVLTSSMEAWGKEAHVTHVFLHSPRHVHVEFGTEEEEAELLADARAGRAVVRPEDLLGGAGAFTFLEEEGGQVQIFGSVRALAPLLRQVAEAFEARLAELPD